MTYNRCSLVHLTSLFSFQPNIIFKPAPQSHVDVSFNEFEFTAHVNENAMLRLLEPMRFVSPFTVLCPASISELYGGIDNEIRNEKSLLNPRSPHAVAKLYRYYTKQQYRGCYNLNTFTVFS